jgi:hypothetical protein
MRPFAAASVQSADFMTREQQQLISKIKKLSTDDVARVAQFLQQLKSPELRAVPLELKAVPGGQEGQTAQFEAPDASGQQETGGWNAAAESGLQADRVVAPAVARAANCDSNPDADPKQIASAACAQWQRRPFQAIDADDLQPIAALFREAVESRAANRFRYGAR